MCDGEGEVDGIIECTKCGGVGQIYQSLLLDDESDCAKCNATGKIVCPDFEEDS